MYFLLYPVLEIGGEVKNFTNINPQFYWGFMF